MTDKVIHNLWRKRLRVATNQGMTDHFCKTQFGHDIAGLQEMARAEAAREAVAGSASAATEAAKLRAEAAASLSKAEALDHATAERQLERNTILARIEDLRAVIPAVEKLIEDTLASQATIATGMAEMWGDPNFVVRQASAYVIAKYNANLTRAVEIPLELAAQRAALVLVRDEIKAAEVQLRKIERGNSN